MQLIAFKDVYFQDIFPEGFHVKNVLPKILRIPKNLWNVDLTATVPDELSTCRDRTRPQAIHLVRAEMLDSRNLVLRTMSTRIPIVTSVRSIVSQFILS